MGKIIDGKKIQEKILKNLKQKREKIFKDEKIKLGAVLIGKNPESISFLKEKEKVANFLKIDFRIYELEKDITRMRLRRYLNQIKKNLDGLIIQLPLPEHLNTQYFLDAIPENKDPDVLSSKAFGKFVKGREKEILPPSVLAIKEIFKYYNIDYKEKIIGVVGRGILVGKPVFNFFINEGVNVLSIRSDKDSLKKFIPLCDIVISGTGKKEIIKKDFIKNKAICIDFGYFRGKDGLVYGDFEFEKIKQKASFITPPIGGTGPITVACVFKNLLELRSRCRH